MDQYNFLAIDIGASSGRAMLGIWDGDKFELDELNRFPNPMVELHGAIYWDIYALYNSIIESLRICASRSIRLNSIGIDTWGVDFCLVGQDGRLIALPRSYRDPYSDGAPEEFFRIISRGELYRRTGIQTLSFNSIFQLFRQKEANITLLSEGTRLLFIPDLLSYMLTGRLVCEHTIASTSQLINPYTREFDAELLGLVGIVPEMLPEMVMPGSVVGGLHVGIAGRIGVGDVPVVAVAGHDTASAVAAVPATDGDFAYLSSGTWSLMGIEVDNPIINEMSLRNNFTNEGGIDGTIRFLKNITGMWLLERCRDRWREMGRCYGYEEITDMARSSDFSSVVDPDDPRFANPADMLAEIYGYCEEHGLSAPESDADVARCIFLSLAHRYAEVFGMLREISPRPINRLYVIGGGSRNSLLNQMTADAIGITVMAGPAEATAIGNCMVQAMAAGLFRDRWEMRRMIASTFNIERFDPSR